MRALPMVWMTSPATAEHGSALVETALVFPLLILLLAGAVSLGRAWTIAIAVQSAAHAGALYGSLHPTDTAGMIAAARTDAADWSVIHATANYDCRCSDGTSAQPGCTSEPYLCLYNSVYNVQVVATATFSPLFYLPSASTFTIRRQVSLRASR